MKAFFRADAPECEDELASGVVCPEEIDRHAIRDRVEHVRERRGAAPAVSPHRPQTRAGGGGGAAGQPTRTETRRRGAWREPLAGRTRPEGAGLSSSGRSSAADARRN